MLEREKGNIKRCQTGKKRKDKKEKIRKKERKKSEKNIK